MTADTRKLLMDLNAQTNALIRQEVGEDRGAVYGQGLERYNRGPSERAVG